MKYKLIENQKISADGVYSVQTAKIQIKSLIPSLESRISDIKGITRKYLFQEPDDTYFSDTLVNENYAAFIGYRLTSGYNYFDCGHVYKTKEVIVGVSMNDTTITIFPTVSNFQQSGFCNQSDFHGYSLQSLEDGILKFEEIYNTDFELVEKGNGAGSVLSQRGTFRQAKSKKRIEQSLNLKGHL